MDHRKREDKAMLTIGTHMSIAKGIAKTAKNVVWTVSYTHLTLPTTP